QHPDHIACSSRSQSEIVVPLYNQRQQIIGVLDADAEQINQFDEIDAEYLQQICQIITKNLLAQ
ncbi:GAF domain-containing protein, partial [Vibrio alginolyticus]|nr:GAF domain-containing protein [Vibrio alginolyticus]